MRRSAIAAPFLAMILLSPLGHGALAVPCEGKFINYPDDLSEVLCTCGPAGATILNLDELTEELTEGPQPFEGTLLQTIGGIIGSWTYRADSNICKAAAHAGLIEDLNFGGEVLVRRAPGCPSYEGGEENGWTSIDAQGGNASFYFPALSNGACPGRAGYANRYSGPPALPALLGKLKASAPPDGFSLGNTQILGHEAFTVENLVLRPKALPGELRMEHLQVTAIDMESAAQGLPPRYLTFVARGLSLAPSDLGGIWQALTEGDQRISVDLSVDLRFDRRKGRLIFRDSRITAGDGSRLDFRLRVENVLPGLLAGLGDGPVGFYLREFRAVYRDAGFLARLAKVLGIDEAMDGAAALDQLLGAARVPPTSVRAQRAAGVLARFLGERSAGAGRLDILALPLAESSFVDLSALTWDDLVDRLALALVYDGPQVLEIDEGIATSLISDRSSYPLGAQTVLRFTGASGAAKDWIALALAGQPIDAYRDYRYLDGQIEGEWSLSSLPIGLYEARLFFNWPDGGYELQDVTWFIVE